MCIRDRVHELISLGKCSEMDMLLDMWIHAIYNDPTVQGSFSAPVVYYRNNTGNPLTSFQSLGERWGHSKTTISRILKKFEELNFITLVSFKGKHGSMIYLNYYLSVMFDISDVMKMCIRDRPRPHPEYPGSHTSDKQS